MKDNQAMTDSKLAVFTFTSAPIDSFSAQPDYRMPSVCSFTIVSRIMKDVIPRRSVGVAALRDLEPHMQKYVDDVIATGKPAVVHVYWNKRDNQLAGNARKLRGTDQELARLNQRYGIAASEDVKAAEAAKGGFTEKRVTPTKEIVYVKPGCTIGEAQPKG